MPRDIDPILLFALVAMLAAVLTVLLWRSNRGVAVVAAGLAVCSGLMVWHERVARAAGTNIRVDLLVTIPVIAVAAIVVGVFSLQRPPMAASRGRGILAIGGIAFAGFRGGRQDYFRNSGAEQGFRARAQALLGGNHPLRRERQALRGDRERSTMPRQSGGHVARRKRIRLAGRL
jgi:hypothetical protein